MKVNSYEGFYGTEPPLNERQKHQTFTRIVWKKTTRIACSIAVQDQGQGQNKTLVVVARYFESGNQENQYTANVCALNATNDARPPTNTSEGKMFVVFPGIKYHLILANLNHLLPLTKYQSAALLS